VCQWRHKKGRGTDEHGKRGKKKIGDNPGTAHTTGTANRKRRGTNDEQNLSATLGEGKSQKKTL